MTRPTTGKVFCIGRNKTGTTSLNEVLRSFGFKMGEQAEGELLLDDWARRDFHPILKLCETADAFQDIPFSLDYTYQCVDHAFPGSKFILTIRDSAKEWLESLSRFHTMIVGKNRLPTAQDLKEFEYRKPGWLWRVHQVVYGVDEESLYDPEIYMRHYEAHNKHIRDYFRFRPDDLLVLNLKASDSIDRLCVFLGIDPAGRQMPFLNRTR
jgi:sulfotransferase family protein